MPFLSRVLGLWLVCASAFLGQGPGPAQPEALGKLFAEAVNSKRLERRVDLVHPKSRTCINERTDGYFYWMFSRQMRNTVRDGKYSASVRPLTTPERLGAATYPVAPTHQLQIDFSSRTNQTVSVVLLIARDGERWYETVPCPSPEVVAGARRSNEEFRRQQEEASNVAAEIKDPLRGEVLALVTEGKRVGAIQKVRAATGKDLVIARSVVGILAGESPADEHYFRASTRHADAAGKPVQDVEIAEIERGLRTSLLTIDVKARGSSVGSSFFLLCSIRQAAERRGGYRYIVKIEKPATNQMLVGFLSDRDEDPGKLRKEFNALRSPEDVIDLEQFAPICEASRF